MSENNILKQKISYSTMIIEYITPNMHINIINNNFNYFTNYTQKK